MIEPDGKAFRDAMRAFVGNCSVITVGDGDEATGLVVTSAISLAADPPLLLACVNRTSSSQPLLEKYRRFGWSSLGAAHQGLAERFSGFGGVKGADRYEGAEWETAVTGARLLQGARPLLTARWKR
jgi:flavin reductase (DIM6/NTAB) family NADH-FMN oxidoreductase RutF